MNHVMKSARGFSILEIMVAIALLGSVLAFAMQTTRRGESQATGRSNADALSSFQQIAAQYFISNRTALEAAMDAGTEAGTKCLLNVNADGTGGTQANSTTKKTCAFDATLLRKMNLWPVGVSVDAPGGGRYVAILRRIYDTAAPPVATGAVDMLVVVARPDGALTAVGPDAQRTEELASSMTTMGGNGGIVPVGNMGACAAVRGSATYQVCGNGWKVNLADFVDATQVTTFSNALPN